MTREGEGLSDAFGILSGNVTLKRILKYLPWGFFRNVIDLSIRLHVNCHRQTNEKCDDENSSVQFLELQGLWSAGGPPRANDYSHQEHGKIYYFLPYTIAITWFRFHTSGNSASSIFTSSFLIVFFFLPPENVISPVYRTYIRMTRWYLNNRISLYKNYISIQKFLCSKYNCRHSHLFHAQICRICIVYTAIPINAAGYLDFHIVHDGSFHDRTLRSRAHIEIIVL